MLYSILFAGLIYLNNGQIDVTQFSCDAQTACSSYSTLAQAQAFGLGILNQNLAGESFTCSDTLGYCTVTCTSNDQAACDAAATALSATGLDCIQGICDYNETNSCTDSSDCRSKSFGSLLPRCDNPNGGTDAGTCVTQSDSPTTTTMDPTTFAPTTAAPTMRPTTSEPITARPTLPNDQTNEPTTAEPTPRPTTGEPTPRPTTAEPTTAAPTTMYECNDDGTCAETNPTDEPYNCEVDAATATAIGLDATCENADNPCDAYCKLKVEMAAAIEGLSDFAYNLAISNDLIPDIDEAFNDYCSSGECPTTTTPKPTTPEPTTPEPTLGEDETARPTGSPTTSEPTTPEPTVDAGSFTCNDDGTCASTGVADKPYNCEVDALLASYAGLDATCEDADNACDAFCALAKGIADVKPTLSPSILELIPDDEDAFDQFCGSGLCPTTAMPTTSMPTMQPTAECEDEDIYNGDCPEDPEDDCSVQFNVTVDFCVFNKKFKRRNIYRYIKKSFIRAINVVLDEYEDFCDEDALRIEYYNVEVDDDDQGTYRQRGNKKPTTKDECEDLDDICGASRKLKKYSLEISVGFYCGECATIKRIFTAITNLVSSGGGGFDTEYEAECYDLGKADDTVCETGFGDDGVLLEFTEAVLAYRNEDGEVEEITTITGSATQRFYFIGLTVAFIVALLH